MNMLSRLSAPLAVHGVGLVSPHGRNLNALSSAGVAATSRLRPAPAPTEDGQSWPASPAYWMDAFDGHERLGPKGLLGVDRMTQLTLVACLDALETSPPLEDEQRRETGLVLGSRAGSMASFCELVRSTYTGLPHMVSPLKFPSAVMNCPAGQAAIWHKLSGVNCTICAGDLSGLAALDYAARMLRLGHAERLLVGAVEEYAPFNAWAHESAHGGGHAFAEAAVVFATSLPGGWCEAGEAPIANVLATRLARLPAARAGDDEIRHILGAQIAEMLDFTGCRGSDLAWHMPGRQSTHSATKEQQLALQDSAGRVPRWQPSENAVFGNFHGASTAFDLALVLAGAPPGLGLLTWSDEDGQLGSLLLQKNMAAAS